MTSSERILTDEMVAEIKAYFPRYPTRQAVTLPALHVVNRHLRHVPLPLPMKAPRRTAPSIFSPRQRLTMAVSRG